MSINYSLPVISSIKHQLDKKLTAWFLVGTEVHKNEKKLSYIFLGSAIFAEVAGTTFM